MDYESAERMYRAAKWTLIVAILAATAGGFVCGGLAFSAGKASGAVTDRETNRPAGVQYIEVDAVELNYVKEGGSETVTLRQLLLHRNVPGEKRYQIADCIVCQGGRDEYTWAKIGGRYRIWITIRGKPYEINTPIFVGSTTLVDVDQTEQHERWVAAIDGGCDEGACFEYIYRDSYLDQ